MYKKIIIVFFAAFALNTVAWFADEIIIDPITKKITIVTDSGSVTADDPVTTTGDTTNTTGSNFAETFIDTGATTTDNIEEDIVETGANDTSTGVIQTVSTPAPTDEFGLALQWMYTNGMTKYNNATDFRADDGLTRQEAAKIIGQAYVVLWYPQIATNSGCTFGDASSFDPSLSPFIAKVCGRWLFQGSKGNYMPNDVLTRPQALAVLVRMMESRKSNESKDPRRQDYFTKANAIGIVDEYSFNSFDKAITRREVALLVYRIKEIVEDENLRIQSINAMNEAAPVVNTWSIDKTLGYTEQLAIIAAGLDASDDPELAEAINWMHDNELTTFTEINDYKPFQILTREAAAKMIVAFANLYADTDKLVNAYSDQCAYTDMSNATDDLKSSITQACERWLIIGKNKTFAPKDPISKADFVAALIRLLEWRHLDETKLPRWKAYYQQAHDLDIVAPSDVITFDQPITRYEVALFLYRFKVKYLLLKNLNADKLLNEIITTVSGSEKTASNGAPEWNVYVSTNLLKDTNFVIGYIELFGTRYKVVKTSMQSYFGNNFVWYADIKDLASDDKLWTLSLIVSNDQLVEGTVRFTVWEFDYTITADTSTTAYYMIRGQ